MPSNSHRQKYAARFVKMCQRPDGKKPKGNEDVPLDWRYIQRLCGESRGGGFDRARIVQGHDGKAREW